MLKIFRKKFFWIILVLILLAIFIIVKMQKPEAVDFSSVIVERIDLMQTVSETGSLVSSLELSYGWETAGKVEKIYKVIGDEVITDDLIAELKNTQQRARLSEAQSTLASAQAKLNLELAGPSDEERAQSLATIDQAKASLEKAKAVAQTNINNAEKALETAENDLQLAEGGEDSQLVNDAYADLINTLKSSMTILTDALTESDNILGIDNALANNEFEEYLSNNNPTSLNTAESSYRQAKNAKNATEPDVLLLSKNSDHQEIDEAAEDVEEAISIMQDHLVDVNNVLFYTNPVGELSQSELDTLKANIDSARTDVDAAGSDVTDGKQAITTARNSLSSYKIAYDKAVLSLENIKSQEAANITIAEADLAAKEAAHAELISDPRAVDVASLRADVSRYSANVQALQDDFEKTRLLALSGGILANIDVEVGENVTANQEVIKLISPQLNVEVDISESDIAKVQLQDPVKISLDAFGEDVEFTGTVVSIEPAETEISGVIYYKTKILLDELEGYEAKSGMTANVDIMTDKREQVLVIPQRAILRKNGERVVRVLTSPTGQYAERSVEVGLRGDDGEVEIISGLQEGEEVITFIKENGS